MGCVEQDILSRVMFLLLLSSNIILCLEIIAVCIPRANMFSWNLTDLLCCAKLIYGQQGSQCHCVTVFLASQNHHDRHLCNNLSTAKQFVNTFTRVHFDKGHSAFTDSHYVITSSTGASTYLRLKK